MPLIYYLQQEWLRQYLYKKNNRYVLKNEDIKIAIADDHKLVRDGIANLLLAESFDVVHRCENGELILKYVLENEVDIVLMDLNMPVMDGWEATKNIKTQKPDVNIIGLSMYDDDLSVVRLIKAGACGYLLKDAEPEELIKAIHSVHKSGFYTSDLVAGYLFKSMTNPNSDESVIEQMSERETEFLKLCCTELTYKEIADKLFVSPRTVDGYRDALFTKLGARSRVGLVLAAIKLHLVEP